MPVCEATGAPRATGVLFACALDNCAAWTWRSMLGSVGAGYAHPGTRFVGSTGPWVSEPGPFLHDFSYRNSHKGPSSHVSNERSLWPKKKFIVLGEKQWRSSRGNFPSGTWPHDSRAAGTYGLSAVHMDRPKAIALGRAADRPRPLSP